LPADEAFGVQPNAGLVEKTNKGAREMESYKEIATDWELWCERVDPNGTMTRDEFDVISIDERIQIIVDCFGKERTE
jgi:hypothetical protein